MILCRTGIGKDVRMSIDRLDPGTNRRRDGFGRVQGGEKNMIEGRATAAACRKFNFSTSLLAISMFAGLAGRSEEHTSELQSLMRISYAVFCLKQKIRTKTNKHK